MSITRPRKHAADIIFDRADVMALHPADVHRACHKKFDTLQTLHPADVFILTPCRHYTLQTLFPTPCRRVFRLCGRYA